MYEIFDDLLFVPIHISTKLNACYMYMNIGKFMAIGTGIQALYGRNKMSI